MSWLFFSGLQGISRCTFWCKSSWPCLNEPNLMPACFLTILNSMLVKRSCSSGSNLVVCIFSVTLKCLSCVEQCASLVVPTATHQFVFTLSRFPHYLLIFPLAGIFSPFFLGQLSGKWRSASLENFHSPLVDPKYVSWGEEL